MRVYHRSLLLDCNQELDLEFIVPEWRPEFRVDGRIVKACPRCQRWLWQEDTVLVPYLHDGQTSGQDPAQGGRPMAVRIVVTNLETNEATEAQGEYLVVVVSSAPHVTTKRANVNTLVYGREPDHVEGMLVNLIVHLVHYAERTLGFLGFRELLLRAIEREAEVLGAYIRAG